MNMDSDGRKSVVKVLWCLLISDKIFLPKLASSRLDLAGVTSDESIKTHLVGQLISLTSHT